MAKTCKYSQYQKYVSHDGGRTWDATSVYQRGRLLEYNSVDCGGGVTLYKWVDITPSSDPTSYICDTCGTSDHCKFYKQQRYVSIDNGATWTPMEEYQKGGLIESGSLDCYSPTPFIEEWRVITPVSGDPSTYICSECNDSKFVITLQDSSVVSAACDSTSAITHAETWSYSGQGVSLRIGSCVTTIGYDAFARYTKLTSIRCAEGLVEIGGDAFNDCESVKTIELPSTLRSIGQYAFCNLHSLCHIICKAVIPPFLGLNPFCNMMQGFTIYVPSGSVSSYKAAEGWSSYANYIAPIP